MNDLFPEIGCQHSEVNVELTPGLIHHGKRVCAKCGRFLGWEPKPETLERARRNATRLERLSGMKLTPTEAQFILSLNKSGVAHLSPKQQQWFDQIYDDHNPF